MWVQEESMPAEEQLMEYFSARWGGLNQFRLALVPCLLLFGWFVEPSLGDLVTNSVVSQLEIRTLRLGQERLREKLAFDGRGQCLYELMDLKGDRWYEVKISYPASTPARFSIDLLPESLKDSTSLGRRLLNTEKIIFHLGRGTTLPDTPPETKQKVLVSVKPDGFVAKPHMKEQPFIIYNIVSEEVVLGVPVQAFWVGFLGLMAISASVLASRQLNSCLHPLQQHLIVKSSKQAL